MIIKLDENGTTGINLRTACTTTKELSLYFILLLILRTLFSFAVSSTPLFTVEQTRGEDLQIRKLQTSTGQQLSTDRGQLLE